MSFNNSGYIPPQYNNITNNFLSNSKTATITPTRNTPLNSPMIDRIHKARAGCSACGKKVA